MNWWHRVKAGLRDLTVADHPGRRSVSPVEAVSGYHDDQRLSEAGRSAQSEAPKITIDQAICKLQKLSKLTSSYEVCQLAITALQEQKKRELLRASGPSVDRETGQTATATETDRDDEEA